MNQNKIVNLIDRVLNSKGRRLKKANEYMYWSPFVVHHKQKLQINIKTQKWHCWVSNEGGYNLFQLFKKLELHKNISMNFVILLEKHHISKGDMKVRK